VQDSGCRVDRRHREMREGLRVQGVGRVGGSGIEYFGCGVDQAAVGDEGGVWMDLILTSIHDTHSGSTKFTTHMDHISQFETSSGTNRSNKSTNRVFIMNTRRDQIQTLSNSAKLLNPR
jgi:hypothetical protein